MSSRFQPTLVGPTVTVRPIAPSDGAELYAVGSDPKIWEALVTRTVDDSVRLA